MRDQNKKREQQLNNNDFNASELCSRKLWQIVTDSGDQSTPITELEAAISELTTRRHYLAELARIGKLGASNHNA
jgi:predicted metal-dependent enzyme (double-stranded beta helix superfamily)